MKNMKKNIQKKNFLTYNKCIFRIGIILERIIMEKKNENNVFFIIIRYVLFINKI